MAILNNSNAISSGGYDINNSLRFRSSASAYLLRTPGTAGNRQKWTWSAWVKLGKPSDFYALFGSTNNCFIGYGQGTGGANLSIADGNTSTMNVVTTALFRDPSAWYHIVFALDTTQATASDRVKIYVNGIQQTSFVTATYPAQNAQFNINNTTAQNIGRTWDGFQYFDGYMTEMNHIDGQQLTPSSFGETSTTTGSWIPKAYTGTYGTNGFYLKFSDIATTSGSNAGLGKDFSGNANYWTTNNISVTAGTTYDAMIDSPTLTSATVANYCTLNPLNASMSPTSGNLNLEPSGTSGNYIAASTLGVSTGKWYYEIVATTYTGSGTAGEFGFRLSSASAQTIGTAVGDASGFAFIMSLSSTWLSQKYGTTAVSLTGLTSATTGTIGMIAVDFDAGYAWVGKDGTWYNSGNPATGANPTITGITAGNYVATIAAYRDGSRNYSFATNFGQRPFTYTPPTGFVRLNTYNLPDSTIKKGNSYMDAVLYNGQNSSQSVTGVNFQPDMVWIKPRNVVGNNTIYDAVRGVTKLVFPNSTNAESTYSGGLTSFDANGFSLAYSADSNFNVSGYTYVGWVWDANGAGSSNTSGSITSTVSVNATAGFSIVTYTGIGSSPKTVGHGLGVAPKMIILKSRGAAVNWYVWHTSLGATQAIEGLNTTAAASTQATFNSTLPTSSVISLGNNDSNNSGSTYVLYVWAEIAGFSKFTSYTGNGSADGPFVYCGFRPKFVMVKRVDASGTNWTILDTARDTYNYSHYELYPNTSGAEVNASSSYTEDILSNGFKIRQTDATWNASGGTYIVAAFAENPFKNSNAR